MSEQVPPKKEYDFSNKDPGAVLTKDELEHFEEGMRLKNTGRTINMENFAKAIQISATEIDMIIAGK